MRNFKNNIVQSNEITRATYSATLIEKKIIYNVFSKIDNNLQYFNLIEVKLTDIFAGKTTSNKVFNISYNLESLKYKMYNEKNFIYIPLFKKISYKKGSGLLLCELDDKIKPFLLQLNGNYTNFNYITAMNFKSSYSMRIYELISQYKSSKFLIIKIDRLKQILNLENKFSRYSCFKKVVLNVAKKEISEKAEFSFKFTEIKKGKQVVRLRFNISKKPKKDKKNKRINITKSQRFKILERDDFTCQYCGAKAPDVVLEIDHIKPISKGGTNDLYNLVTSCFECNRGKSNKIIKIITK